MAENYLKKVRALDEHFPDLAVLEDRVIATEAGAIAKLADADPAEEAEILKRLTALYKGTGEPAKDFEAIEEIEDPAERCLQRTNFFLAKGYKFPKFLSVHGTFASNPAEARRRLREGDFEDFFFRILLETMEIYLLMFLK